MDTPYWNQSRAVSPAMRDRERAEAVLKRKMGESYRYLRPSEKEELLRDLLRTPRRDRRY